MNVLENTKYIFFGGQGSLNDENTFLKRNYFSLKLGYSCFIELCYFIY
jgi:hypothetical protein